VSARRTTKRRKTFELKKEATDSLADVQVQKTKGTYVAPKQVPTFREVAGQWFANKQGMHLRAATLSCYRVNVECHILPADFADVQLTAIEVADSERFRNSLGEKTVRGRRLSVKRSTTFCATSKRSSRMR